MRTRFILRTRFKGKNFKDWYHLYIDASFEPDGYSGIGGLVLDPHGVCFSEVIDQGLLSAIMRPDQKTPILELEALAIFIGLQLFAEKVRGTRLVVFTDNLSAQASLVKCRSNNLHIDMIIKGICTLEENLSMMCWLERVPSYSNPSDVLSREEIPDYHGVKRSRIILMEAWQRCQEESSPSLHPRGEGARLT